MLVGYDDRLHMVDVVTVADRDIATLEKPFGAIHFLAADSEGKTILIDRDNESADLVLGEHFH